MKKTRKAKSASTSPYSPELIRLVQVVRVLHAAARARVTSLIDWTAIHIRSAMEWLASPASLSARELATIGCLSAVIAFVAWLPITASRGVFVGFNDDLGTQQYTARAFFAECFAHSTLPLWNPYLLNGMPSQTGFSPFINLSGLITLLFSDQAIQVELDIVLHSWIALWGMTMFFGRYGYSRIACLAGGCGWAIGGVATAHAAEGNLDLNNALAWFPWVLLAYQWSLHFQGAGFLGIVSLLLAVQLSYGNWQGLYLTVWAAVGLKGLAILLGSAREIPVLSWSAPWKRDETLRSGADGKLETCGSVSPRHRLRDARRWVGRTALILVTSSLLSAFYSWPCLQTAHWANMHERALELKFPDNPTFQAWQTLLSPAIFEYVSQTGSWCPWTPWEGNFYLGIVPFMFAFSFVYLARKVEWLPQIFMLVFSLALGLGANSGGIFSTYRDIDPGACFLTPPCRYWLVAQFCLLWLSVRACSEYCLLPEQDTRARKLLLFPKLWLGVLGLMWLEMYYDGPENRVFLNFVRLNCNPAVWHRFIQGQNVDGLGIIYVTLWMKLGWTVLLLLCIIYSLVKFSRPLGTCLVLFLVLSDSVFTVNHFAVLQPNVFLKLPITWEHFLKAESIWNEDKTVDLEGNRLELFSQRLCYDPATPQRNRFAAYRLAEISGSAAFVAPAFEDGVRIIYHIFDDPPLPNFGPFDKNRLLDILGTRYFLTPRGPNDLKKEHSNVAKLRDIGAWEYEKQNKVCVFDNLGAAPRAWLCEHPTMVASHNQKHLVGRMLASDPKGEWPCVLDNETFAAIASKLRSTTSTTEPDVKVASLESTSVEIDVNCQSGGVLVLSDLYWPGWLASVDEIPTTVLSVNGGLCRGVLLPEGHHLVKFRYFPTLLLIGLATSMIAFAIFLTYGLFGIWRYLLE